MKLQKILLFSFLLSIVFFSSCRFSKILKSQDVREKYDAAIKYYEEGEYYKASVLLADIMPLIIGTREQEIAQFYYAYCGYYQKAYSTSAYEFKKFYTTFRTSQFVEEAKYMEIKCMYKNTPVYNLDQGNTGDAIRTTQQFLNAYPKSKYFEECSEVMAELRFKLERKAYENAYLYYKISDYRAAVVSFKNFQKDFPDSQKYAEQASYYKLGAQYELARISYIHKQTDRYKEAIKFYRIFIAKYPDSKKLKDAENIYEKCIRDIGKVRKQLSASK